MDSLIWIMGAVLITVIFVPIVYLFFSAKKKAYKLKKEMTDLALKLDLKITDQEIWNTKIICIDSMHKVLLFIRSEKGNRISQVVELLRTSKCRLLHDHQLIGLDIETRDSAGLSNVQLILYDGRFDDAMRKELHLEIAKRWVNAINDVIETKRKRNPMKAA